MLHISQSVQSTVKPLLSAFMYLMSFIQPAEVIQNFFSVSSLAVLHRLFWSLNGGNLPELTTFFEMSIFIYFTAIYGLNLICIDAFHTLSPYA